MAKSDLGTLKKVKKQIEARKYPPAYKVALRRALRSTKTGARKSYGRVANVPKVGYVARTAFGFVYAPRLMQRVEALEHKVALLEEKIELLEKTANGGKK